MMSSPRRLWSGVLGAMTGLLLAGHPPEAQRSPLEPPTTLSMNYSSDHDVLVVRGWNASELEAARAWGRTEGVWSDLLQVRIVLPDRDHGQLPPVVGEYAIAGDALHFRPRYGWSEGQRYEARLDPRVLAEGVDSATPREEAVLEISFTVSARTETSEPPTVTAIYPSADILPENLLRFYVEFSRPMRRGEVYDHVYLLDVDGRRVEAPFLRVGQEFWSSDMTRLTLLLDPGRIKRGVAPNVQAGVPLGSSSSYTLVVGADLADGHGRPLARTHRKSFTVTKADRTSPTPEAWQLSRPEPGTRQPLVVTLYEAADPVVAGRFIRVEDERGEPLPGTLAFRDDERVLTFTPREEWSDGTYRLAVHPSLEDYAGNRVSEVFDMEPGTISELTSEDAERTPVYRYFRPAHRE